MLYVVRKKISLGNGKALWVVREDRNPEALVSFTEGEGGKVRKRFTVSLTKKEAMQVAKVLAGIFTDLDDDGDGDDFEEDTMPGGSK